MREVLARILDGSEFTEYRPEYGRTLVCGYGRAGGWSVGVVANQKVHLREKGKPVDFMATPRGFEPPTCPLGGV